MGENMTHALVKRFRGFLPVIVDVECGGVNPQKDALLELGAVTIKMDEEGFIHPDQEYHYHVIPFEGGNLDPAALAFNKIQPFHPFRFAISEAEMLNTFFKAIRKEYKAKACTRAIMVAHNAWFDQHFVNAAADRCKNKKSPFHRFSSFDTATLGALAYGQSVLPKALKAAGIPYNQEEAHSALYDARCTAELFCKIVNQWKILGGWPVTEEEQAQEQDQEENEN